MFRFLKKAHFQTVIETFVNLKKTIGQNLEDSINTNDIQKHTLKTYKELERKHKCLGGVAPTTH